MAAAAFGRASASVALGLALTSFAYAGHDIATPDRQVDPTDQKAAADPKFQDLRTAELGVFVVTASAAGQDDGRLDLARAVAGMRLDARSHLPIAQVPETLDALLPPGLSRDYTRSAWNDPVTGLFNDTPARKLVLTAAADQLTQPKLGGLSTDAGATLLSAPRSRVRAWSMGLSRTDMLWNYDRATFTAYLPMNGTEAVRKVSGKLFDSEDVGSVVSGMRALQLIASRRIITEFTYSTQFNKYSRFDATAIYRLNSNTNSGKSDLVMGLYYKAVF